MTATAQASPPQSAAADVRFAIARTRVAVAILVGTVGGVVAGLLTSWQVALLVAWSSTGIVVVVWAVLALRTLDGRGTKAVAKREDDSRAMADLLLLTAAVASLAAIGLGLLKAADAKGSAEGAITGLAVMAVVSSWAVVHTVFTLRYARLYYEAGGGVDFNSDEDPDYRDFAYLALTVGMTFQVSDTNLTTKAVRRTATRHALLSYLFGAVIVAMVINVVAGLLSK